jgi:prevent-host-death family protein
LVRKCWKRWENEVNLRWLELDYNGLMIQIGAFQAKNTLGSLLDLVESGEEIVITRHGRPVARLVPNTGKRDVAAARAAFERIRERAKGSGGFDWEELKALRDTGRP